MPIDDFLDLIGKLGIAAALGITLWWAILTPRRTTEGRRRSSLLVPGWLHDDKIAEIETVRVFYEKLASDREQEHDRRIQEWRGFRDEEKARRKDTERQREQLLEAVNGLTGVVNDLASDVQILLKLAQDAAGDSAQSKTGGGGVSA